MLTERVVRGRAITADETMTTQETAETGGSRRDFLKKAAVGGAGAALVWTAPTVTTVAHAGAAGTGIPVAPGECCRVKWNTDHAEFQTSCHGAQSKDEVNRARGFQIPDPKVDEVYAGLGDDDIAPDNQCCETSVLKWNAPALDCPLSYLNDVITVTGNKFAVLDQGQSMTFTVDQTKAFECYLTDPAAMVGAYEKINAVDCTTGSASSSGLKSTEWTITWTGSSINTGGSVPIFIKFMFMCGDSVNCADIGESGYTDPRTLPI